jgi:transposase
MNFFSIHRSDLAGMAWEETVRVENRQKLLERRRLQAGRWMLKGLSKAEVARRVGVSPSAVTAWGKRLEAEGLQALKSRGPRGRPAGLDAAQRRALARELKRGAVAQGFPTELWTLPRMGQLIGKLFGRRYSDSQVSRILASLGFSCQRPTGRAMQRDEKAIRQWKRTRWPVLKKRRTSKTYHSVRGRIGVERTPHPRAHLGTERTNAGAPVQL